MNGVSQINITENISLITLNNLPSDTQTIWMVFEDFTAEGINIDMITKSAAMGGHVSLSFTAFDKDIATILSLVRRLREDEKDIRPLISSSNCKIQLYGEEMRTMNGVAARAIKGILNGNGEILLMSTSEVDISILVSQADVAEVLTALEVEFSVSPQNI